MLNYVQPENDQHETPTAPNEPVYKPPSPIQTVPLNNTHPNIEPQIAQPNKSRKSKILLYFIAILVVFVVACGGSYYFGTKNYKVANTTKTNQTSVEELTVPKDANVNEECVDGRGKQYILPRDIPGGPIYDVNESKVVALEFLVKYSDIQDGAEKYMNLKLNGVKYDHLMLMPVMPHAGQTEPHFHLIAFLITPEASKAIICKM